MFKRFNTQGKKNIETVDPIQYLIDRPGLWRKSEIQRKEMTVSCKDTEYIPKVKDAGKVFTSGSKKNQVMHNGVLVELGGYHGKWMTEIIKELKGHHEPQEEKVFYEILKHVRPGSTMIEFGSFWAYYSLWFQNQVKGSKNICVEPDLHNLEVGRRNAKLNKAPLEFMHAAVGPNDGEKITISMDSDPSKKMVVSVRTVDSIMKEKSIDFLELLHLDVQGYEADALRGSIETIKSKKIRFVCVSTHHYLFSNNPNTHNECLDLIRNNGGHVIASHTVPESFSGDGLIVASFLDKDSNISVETSVNHSNSSLFRPYEEDIAILASWVREKE